VKRQALVLAGVVALAAALAVPAQTASAAGAVPSAPTSVAVTGTAALDATVTWSAPKTTTAPITGYTVTISPAQRQPNHGVDTLAASARSDRFGALTAGTTYSFVVRAVGRNGASSPVTVTYTAPLPQSFYGLSATGAVVRFPLSGGAGSTVVPSGGSGYAVDDIGDVLVPATGGTSIVLYPASGGAAKTVATGLSITGGLQIDVAGDVFFQSGSNIVELPVTGAAQRTVGAYIGPWTVSSDGTVTTITPGGTFAGMITAVVSYSPSGATTTRTLSSPLQEAATAIRLDGHGNVFFLTAAAGPNWLGWTELPAGSLDTQIVTGSILNELGATYQGGFVEVHDARYCSGTSSPATRCTQAEFAITTRLSVAPDGTQTSIPASGFEIQALGQNATEPGAADDAGDLLVVVASGDTPGLWLVPAAGGAAKRVDAGQFTQLQVNWSA
jgi:hypothetical protein